MSTLCTCASWCTSPLAQFLISSRPNLQMKHCPQLLRALFKLLTKVERLKGDCTTQSPSFRGNADKAKGVVTMTLARILEIAQRRGLDEALKVAKLCQEQHLIDTVRSSSRLKIRASWYKQAVRPAWCDRFWCLSSSGAVRRNMSALSKGTSLRLADKASEPSPTCR